MADGELDEFGTHRHALGGVFRSVVRQVSSDSNEILELDETLRFATSDADVSVEVIALVERWILVDREIR